MSHDPGLLLVDKQGQAHVCRVDLTVMLRPVTHAHKDKEYRNHSLLLYTDNGDHALLVGQVDVQPMQASKPFPFYVRVEPTEPTTLICRWFAHARDLKSDAAWALEMVASGASATGDEIILLDIARQSQAVVEVKGWPWRQDHESPQYVPHPLLRELVQDVRKAYAKVPDKKPNDVFTQIQVHLGNVVRSMPVLFFALLAQTQLKATPQQATAYFEHVLGIALALSPDGGLDEEQLMTDLLTLPALCWAYRPDKTRSLDEIDQWSSLWSYPSSKVVAFDCEDGSIALMQLFVVLQTAKLVNPTPGLARMQALAKRYTPWLAVNELLSSSGSAKGGVGGGDYVLHCCLLLLPITKDAPAISIESTARCSGPWRTKGGEEETKQARVDRRVPRGDRGVMHVRTPISVVRAHRMYGRLIALVSCAEGRARHLLMEGVDTEGFMMRGGRGVSDARVAVDIPLAKLEVACARELQLTPTPRFPEPPPPQQTESGSIPSDGSVILPVFASEAARAASTQVHITTDVSLFVFQG